MLKIWDKQESINGVDAVTVLADREDLRNEEQVLLVINEAGTVTNIELPSTLRANYGLDESLSALEVGQYHLDQLSQGAAEQQEVDELRAEIAELRAMLTEMRAAK